MSVSTDSFPDVHPLIALEIAHRLESVVADAVFRGYSIIAPAHRIGFAVKNIKRRSAINQAFVKTDRSEQ